jgi:putative transcriptional regulator
MGGLGEMDREAFEKLLETARVLRRKRHDRAARLVGLKPPRAVPKHTSGADVDAKAIRRLTGLSQAKFAELLGIELATLRNWEQGRRVPTGPGRALLRAIGKNPIEVIKALSG